MSQLVKSKSILITGVAGFIGYHLCLRLINAGHKVFGIDNLNDYYDTKLKKSRLTEIKKISSQDNFLFIKADISNKSKVNEFFEKNNFDIVVNLAAQAGVRYSITNPDSYIDSNLKGFFNIIECCRNHKIGHLIYASSSSVYGMNIKQPFSTDDNVDFPISLYAATKKSNELIAYSYSHLYNIPTTGLRFFTVYGPYGRPDMAYFNFTKAICENKPIKIFNHGKMKRDFTYIDDIVEGIVRLLDSPPKKRKHPNTKSKAPYKIYNIGNNQPVTLSRFVRAIEKALNKEAKKIFLPMQEGDVPITYADIDDLYKDFSFMPKTSIEVGIENFVRWYKLFYGKK